jgi:hypothetical protein
MMTEGAEKKIDLSDGKEVSLKESTTISSQQVSSKYAKIKASLYKMSYEKKWGGVNGRNCPMMVLNQILDLCEPYHVVLFENDIDNLLDSVGPCAPENDAMIWKILSQLVNQISNDLDTFGRQVLRTIFEKSSSLKTSSPFLMFK